jgi:hypothetical protein
MLQVEGWLIFLESSSKDGGTLYADLNAEYKVLLEKFFKSKR